MNQADSSDRLHGDSAGAGSAPREVDALGLLFWQLVFILSLESHPPNAHSLSTPLFRPSSGSALPCRGNLGR